MWGLVYVNVCVAFKVVVMVFSSFFLSFFFLFFFLKS
jgi:hypothetical protein